MLPFKRTKKLLLIALAGALVGLAGYSVLNFEVRDRLSNLAQLENELEREVEISSQHKSLAEVIAATVEDRSTVDKYFVGEDDVVGFITTVESAAVAAGVSLQIASIAVESGPEGSPLESLELKLSAIGGWSSLFHFISLLEHLPEKGEIVEASLDGVGSSWSSAITFRVLKLKEQS